MKRFILFAITVTMMVSLASCTVKGAGGPAATASPEVTASQSPASVPARPGSGVTGDPSGNLEDLQEVTGTVQEVRDGLVLIDLADNGGEFMLRFSENTHWDDGVSQEIQVGGTVTCLIKPEPTFAAPSQGEVMEVMVNEAPQ